MNNTFLILLSVLLSSEFIESRPRYGYRFWGKFVKSSEESSEESCVDCFQTNIGKGYVNRNIIRNNSYPKSNNGQTDMYQETEKQNVNESQLVTGSTFRTTSQRQYNSFGGNGLQDGGENYNNQRPFRTNSKPINENQRPYNDFKTNYNRQRSGEIGDFGNGHDNTNTFNIHKKNIYIT